MFYVAAGVGKAAALEEAFFAIGSAREAAYVVFYLAGSTRAEVLLAGPHSEKD